MEKHGKTSWKEPYFLTYAVDLREGANVRKMAGVGRPRVLSAERLLEAVRLCATDSPAILSEKLGVSKVTVWKELKQIHRNRVNAILKEMALTELKPFEIEYSVFLRLHEVASWIKLLDRAQLSPNYKNTMLHGFHKICVALNRRPEKLTIKEAADFIEGCRKTEEHGRERPSVDYDITRRALRSWFMVQKGFSGSMLKANGISGEIGKSFGNRAHDRLTIEQRHGFYEALRAITNNNPVWMALPKWLYYTGTRINASLKLSIAQITWKNGIGIAYVVDKGRHKSGRERWTKLIIGDLKQAIEENLKFQETPSGKLFPLSCQEVRRTFREAFKMTNVKMPQPTHIWRHTSAQDLLESNGWNYELAASILGWKDTRTLKLFYGAMGESAKENALRKAMGEPIQEKITEFRF